ncbi:MAG: hypothetical protein DRJ97_02495 [Thermoprotei archaeon]|nr:MAG: hypothetical protein DRJ97_02495 [Thermoprotei archaeon]
MRYLKTLRDLVIIELPSIGYMVVSCDSIGSVGPNPLDEVKVNGRIVGKFLARVALMEVMSVNAQPIACAVTLSINQGSQVAEILDGVREELSEAGVNLPEEAFIMSTEKNFKVSQTGVGIAIMGLARDLKTGKALRGDLLVAIGKPCVGIEVLDGEERDQIADLKDLAKLMRKDYVHEVIPVGSKGIIHEALTLARNSSLTLKLFDSPHINLYKSAGPATVLLAAIDELWFTELRENLNKPVNIVGKLL